jgi:hypothetical protein
MIIELSDAEDDDVGEDVSVAPAIARARPVTQNQTQTALERQEEAIARLKREIAEAERRKAIKVRVVATSVS